MRRHLHLFCLAALLLLPGLTPLALAQDGSATPMPRPGEYGDAKDWLTQTLAAGQSLDEDVRTDLVDCSWKRLEDNLSTEEMQDFNAWARGEAALSSQTSSRLQSLQRETESDGLESLKAYCPDKIEEFEAAKAQLEEEQKP